VATAAVCNDIRRQREAKLSRTYQPEAGATQRLVQTNTSQHDVDSRVKRRWPVEEGACRLYRECYRQVRARKGVPSREYGRAVSARKAVE
jgi:hypothetical protein